MMVGSAEKTTEQLRRELLEHRHFRYRGCAPDPDNPLRMVGNPEQHVGAHHGPDAWAPEGQRERRAREDAAIEVCLSCPVMVACDLYASSVRADGKLAEPDGVWGGRRSLERHKALIARRVAVAAAPSRVFETAQKRAVLRALAACWDPFEVAAEASRLLAVWGKGPAAEMDVRTANWQRSSLVRLLGLPKDATRMRALAAARERGLLEDVDLVEDDGRVPAIPSPTKVSEAPGPVETEESEPVPVPMPIWPRPDGPPPVPMPAVPRPDGPPPVPMPTVPASSCRVRRARVAMVSGQLSLDDALAVAAVTSLKFRVPSRLEAAA